MIKLLRLLLSVFACFALFVGSAYAADMKACKATPQTAVRILQSSIKTLYNTFPIRIAGIAIMSFDDLEDFNLVGSTPICTCIMPPPIYIRVGVPFSMWEPAHLIETVKHPWCSPSAGFQIPVSMNAMAVGSESVQSIDSTQHAAAQLHLISYPVWNLIGMFVDVACFQFAKSFDYLYLTELDPLWQNDMWATLLGPEAALVANPVAQLACSVDSVAAAAGFPLDALFWCMGSWGSTYPMSQHISSGGYVQAQAGLAARFVAKMHRELVLWGTMGVPTVTGYCQRYPAPIWLKSQYGFLPMFPIAGTKRIPTGRTGLTWSSLKNYPMSGDDFVFMLYNKRDCCLF